jgi:hypothetical protein
MLAKVLVSVLSLALVVSFAPAASAAKSDSLVVLQDAPVLANHPNLDVQPNTTGAVLFFGADLRNTKGRKIGELIGQVTTLDVTLDNVEEVDRFRELVFNMKKGQIVVLGAAQYTSSTVTTKKRKDGTYRHSFSFVD